MHNFEEIVNEVLGTRKKRLTSSLSVKKEERIWKDSGNTMIQMRMSHCR